MSTATSPKPTPPPSADTAHRSAGETRSVGEIVADVATDMTTLIRKEMDLAKTEMKQEFTKAGKGAGMLGGAGATGYLAVFFISLALVYLLDNVMPVELAALIVGLIWAAVAGLLAMSGKKELEHANPDLPKTKSQVKEDIQWTKAHTS